MENWEEDGPVMSFILDTLNLGLYGTSSEQCWKDRDLGVIPLEMIV